jgi:hypothetical protein
MPYAQYTLPQLQTLFYEQVGGNTTFWRTDEVTRILQESFRVFNCLTGFWRARVDMGLTVAGQHYYSTPAGLTYLLRVEVSEVPLGSTSLYDLDYGQPTWESETATLGQLPQAFAPVGFNLFALWPASFAGGESLIVEGVEPAPVLAAMAPGAFVNLGQDELMMILNYAEHIAQFKEGGQEFEASQVQLKEFLKGTAGRNAVLMESSKFRKWMGLTDQRKRPMRVANERVGAR